MPEEFQNMYKAEDIELPVNFTGMHFDYGVHNMRDERLAEYPRDAMEIRQHTADYYAMISHLDYKVGQIIDKLKEKNLYDNTIIVFAADNGLAVGRHGLMGKQNCYDHSIRVPLIMAGPGIPKNAKCDNFVYLLDVFPTLCSLTGVEVPDSVEGKDFSPMFKDNSFKTRDSIYAGYSDKIRSVKKDGYKLIEYRFEDAKIPSFEVNKDSALSIKNKKVTQLFNLESDPYETVNLADKKEYRDKVEELRQLMKQYRDEWDEMEHPIARKFWERY
jgi:arylsulfatase A-like enzyme